MSDRCGWDAVHAWVAAHRDSLPQTLEELANYPMPYRRAIQPHDASFYSRAGVSDLRTPRSARATRASRLRTSEADPRGGDRRHSDLAGRTTPSHGSSRRAAAQVKFRSPEGMNSDEFVENHPFR